MTTQFDIIGLQHQKLTERRVDKSGVRPDGYPKTLSPEKFQNAILSPKPSKDTIQQIKRFSRPVNPSSCSKKDIDDRSSLTANRKNQWKGEKRGGGKRKLFLGLPIYGKIRIQHKITKDKREKPTWVVFSPSYKDYLVNPDKHDSHLFQIDFKQYLSKCSSSHNLLVANNQTTTSNDDIGDVETISVFLSRKKGVQFSSVTEETQDGSQAPPSNAWHFSSRHIDLPDWRTNPSVLNPLPKRAINFNEVLLIRHENDNAEVKGHTEVQETLRIDSNNALLDLCEYFHYTKITILRTVKVETMEANAKKNYYTIDPQTGLRGTIPESKEFERTLHRQNYELALNSRVNYADSIVSTAKSSTQYGTYNGSDAIPLKELSSRQQPLVLKSEEIDFSRRTPSGYVMYGAEETPIPRVVEMMGGPDFKLPLLKVLHIEKGMQSVNKNYENKTDRYICLENEGSLAAYNIHGQRQSLVSGVQFQLLRPIILLLPSDIEPGGRDGTLVPGGPNQVDIESMMKILQTESEPLPPFLEIVRHGGKYVCQKGDAVLLCYQRVYGHSKPLVQDVHFRLYDPQTRFPKTLERIPEPHIEFAESRIENCVEFNLSAVASVDSLVQDTIAIGRRFITREGDNLSNDGSNPYRWVSMRFLTLEVIRQYLSKDECELSEAKCAQILGVEEVAGSGLIHTVYHDLNEGSDCVVRSEKNASFYTDTWKNLKAEVNDKFHLLDGDAVDILELAVNDSSLVDALRKAYMNSRGGQRYFYQSSFEVFEGRTLLHFCCMKKYTSCVKYLVDNFSLGCQKVDAEPWMQLCDPLWNTLHINFNTAISVCLETRDHKTLQPLIDWLRKGTPKERELKEMNMKKVRNNKNMTMMKQAKRHVDNNPNNNRLR